MLKIRITTILVLLFLTFTFGGCVIATPDSTPERPTYVPTAQTPSNSPSAIETVLGYVEECTPPCWHSITPGISSEEDVVRVLEQLTRDGRIVSYYTQSGGSDYEVILSGGRVTVFLDGGQVDYVWGTFYDDGAFRVQQVIERFGEPEGVAFIDKMPEIDLSCKELEDSPDWDPTGGFLLLYPSQGVTFSGYKYYYGFICPQMATGQFNYYQSRSLTDALGEGKSVVFGDFGERDFDSEDLVEWHGYGQGY